jgi:SulP family sulfate permease
VLGRTLEDIRAAFVTAAMSLASSLSTSALIFAGPLQKFLGLGVSAALITATLAAIITSLGSGFRLAIASPASTIAAALAVTITALDPTLEGLPDHEAAAIVFAVIAITTLTTGVALAVIGLGRLGKIIRFIPFPVVAGFMGTSGWLLASGAIRMTTQLPLSPSALPLLLEPDKLVALGLVIVWAIFLLGVTKRFRMPTLLPTLLIGAVLGTNAIIAALGLSHDQPTIRAMMFQVDPDMSLGLPAYVSVQLHVLGPAILPILPNILAVIFIAILTTLLTCTGLESELDVDADLDRELKIQGLSNVASGLGGGYIGLISVGTSMSARAAGAHTRLPGYLTSLVCLVVLLVGMAFVNDVPRFIIGGLQLQLGIQLLWTWCIASRSKMPLSEWLLVLAVVLAAIELGFMPAVVCGIVGGCIIFAVDVSRINVIRRVYGLNDRSSGLVRSGDELAVLAREGERVQIVELSGFIFFGSVYQILSRVRTLISARQLHMLIIDFTAVSGGDSSMSTVLSRLNKLLKRQRVELVFAGIRKDLLPLVQNSGAQEAAVLMPDHNAALERGEEAVLALSSRTVGIIEPLAGWLTRSLGRADFAAALMPHLERIDYTVGDYLCRQGEPTDTLIFIERGRVAVMVAAGNTEVCVRIFGPHTITGEQGFLQQQPRTASLKVEADTRAWILSRRAYEDLIATNAELVIALMRDIVRVQSERLNFATRQNTALAG